MRKLSLYPVVENTIKILNQRGMRVSIQSIIDTSFLVNTNGISKSAILTNIQAYNLYIKNRSWKPKLKNRITSINKLDLKAEIKNENRREYLNKFNKKMLIQHIIELEVTLIHLHKKHLQLQLESMQEFSTDFVNKPVDKY